MIHLKFIGNNCTEHMIINKENMEYINIDEYNEKAILYLAYNSKRIGAEIDTAKWPICTLAYTISNYKNRLYIAIDLRPEKKNILVDVQIS